ncbi:MAG: trigger factor [Candidatus Parcubacteria bacterium]|nr:trigger factor [Candidatus Parcubacteria bacterium]
MDFTIKELAKSQLEINFVLTPEDLKPYLEQALNDIARNASVAGYRPGKAPANLIKDKVDPVALLEEGAEKAIRDIWPKTAKEQQIDGVGAPKVEITKIVPNNNLEFRVTVDILPKIELPDLKSVLSPLGKERISSKVEKKEIENSLNWLADSRAITIKVERGAQEGDSVNVNFKTFNEGKELTESQADNYPLVLGKGHFLEGFEKELVGLKANEEKTFSVVAPSDYWEENLRGKKLDFQVKVNEVSERKLPLVDDGFASDQVKLDVPESLIEGELNAMIHNLRHQCEDHGLSFEDYLKQLKKTEEEMRKDLSVGASSKAKADLILRAISKEQKFSANEDEVNVAVAELLHSLGGEISELNNEEVKLYAKEMVIRRKTWDYLESFLPQEGVKVTPEITTQVPKDMV